MRKGLLFRISLLKLRNSCNEGRRYFVSAVSWYDLNVRDMIKLLPWSTGNCLRNVDLVVVGGGTNIRENMNVGTKH